MSTERTNEIEGIASGWLIRRESGQWTEADQVRFEQWLDASTLNRVAFLRLELAWENAARLRALGAGIPGDRPPPPGRWNLTPFFDARGAVAQTHTTSDCDAGCVPAARAESSRSHRHWWFSTLAASVLLACGIGGYRAFFAGADRYTTPVGGIASVPLLDGSKITLNTNSQVRVALTDAQRHVELKHGEAFFEVAKDANRPFVVEAGSKRVIAVGTKFSVRRAGVSVEVVVTEGKVRVEDTSRPMKRSAASASGSAAHAQLEGPVFLTQGAIAHADDAGVLVQRKSLPEAEAHLSWRVGVLMFRDQSLGNAVAEFNRYNVRQIVITDAAVAALKVEGNFKANNVDAFVRLLQSGFPIQAAVEDNAIILSSR